MLQVIRAAALVTAQDMQHKFAVAACTRVAVQHLWLSGPLIQEHSTWTLARHPFSSPPAVQTRPSSAKSAHEGAVARQQRQLAQLDFKEPVMGKIIDPYMRPKSLRESFSSFKAFKLRLGTFWMNLVQHQQAMATAKSSIQGFTSQGLLEEVANLYVQLSRAQAEMQPDPVRPIVSHNMFIKLRNEVDQRRRKGWHEIKWQMLDEENLAKHVKQVQARSHKLLPASPYSWLQFTFCIQSKQRFAAYSVDSKGRRTLVEGDPEKEIDVLEYCVFERKVRSDTSSMKQLLKGQHIALEDSRWRFIGWLQP